MNWLRSTFLTALILIGSTAWALPESGDPAVSVVLLLQGEPLASPGIQETQAAVAVPVTPGRREVIARQQAALEVEIHRLGGQVTDRFDTLLNALVVRIPKSRLAEVRQLSGVRSVRRERLFRPLLSSSVPFVGAPGVWKLPTGGGAGTGIRIAIIDSGIDYLHADFGGSGDPAAYLANDSTVVEAGTFPTAKVIGGFDFVGDEFDGNGDGGPGSTVAIPDRDPLDPSANGHGTHVAGIAAGFGVLTNGLPYSGDYTADLDLSQFRVGPGVAPQALLYAYKVFGRQGSTTFSAVARALERSLDPNQDGSFGDHVDVVNLSLGSPFGLSGDQEPEVEAVNRLSQQGVIVVVAAGNNGNTHYVCASPGVATRAVTVANSLDDGATFSVIRVTAPAAVVGDYTAVEGSFTPKLATMDSITAPVVLGQPANACDDLLNSAELAGRIALVDRGTCFFVDKIRRAQKAGALGVIVVNNADGAPFEMGGQGDTSDILIPGVMISRLDGSILKAQLDKGLTVTLADFAAVAHPELADQLSESSSRGPSAEDGHLKPDLAAPGSGIVSAKAGAGTQGVALSGTSMAAPHVAGAAALLREARPTWSVEDIKAVLMNTAAPTRGEQQVEYPESRTGGGRLRLEQAFRALSVARGDSGEGDVSLSFGSHQLSAPLSLIRNVRVVNRGALAATFSITSRSTPPSPGVLLVPLVPSVTVPGRGSLLVPVRLDLDPAAFRTAPDSSTPALVGDRPRLPLGEASGEIRLENASLTLNLPWHVVARATGHYQATATEVGLTNAPSATLHLSTRGSAAHPRPLASVFLLGFEQGPGAGDSGNLVAAGAASDFLQTRTSGDPRVFFGLATAGDWVTPQYQLVALEVEIDLNGDGFPEYILLNSSGGNLNGQGFDPDLSNDALMTLVFDTSRSTEFLSAGGILNVLPPTFRDTAPYHNRVVILSATARQLGLSESLTRFRYRVTTTGLRELVQTETPWIDFDLANPVLDATPHGLLGTPFFDEGRSIRMEVNRDAAVRAGFGPLPLRPLKALLLHQHNVADAASELISLRLDSSDADQDGLPDGWELEWLGDLAGSGATDSDLDGLTDAAELAAGTNPLDIRLLAPEQGILRWMGTAGRRYTIEHTEDLSRTFQPLFRHLSGVTGTNSLMDPTLGSGLGAGFYRVVAE